MKNLIYISIFVLCFSLIISAQNSSKHVSKANNLLSKGDINGAIAVLDKAVKKNEGSFEVYRMRSSLYGMIGNLQAEFNDLSKAIELKSDEGELYEKRAAARMFLRQDTKLILDDLELAIANGRKVEKVYRMRAMFRHQSRDFDGALADYQTAVGLNPDSASSIVGLAGIYRSMGDEEQAILVLENFISKYENSLIKGSPVKGKVVAQSDAIIVSDKDMLVGSNSVVIVSDDDKNSMPPTREELNKFTEKLENTKNTAFAYSQLASLYKERGDYEKALETVGKAITLDPTDAQAIGVRGTIKTSLKDYEGAYNDLSRAIKDSPSFPQNYADRGVLLLLMNRDEEAQTDFDKFYNLVSFPAARTNLEKRIAEVKKMRKGEEN